METACRCSTGGLAAFGDAERSERAHIAALAVDKPSRNLLPNRRPNSLPPVPSVMMLWKIVWRRAGESCHGRES